MTPNLATAHLLRAGETVDDWDGFCGELADAIVGPEDDILYVEGEIAWRYHMVALIGGLVHDAWCHGPARTPQDWLARMFGESHIELSLNGETFYTGPADAFPLACRPCAARPIGDGGSDTVAHHLFTATPCVPCVP